MSTVAWSEELVGPQPALRLGRCQSQKVVAFGSARSFGSHSRRSRAPSQVIIFHERLSPNFSTNRQLALLRFRNSLQIATSESRSFTGSCEVEQFCSVVGNQGESSKATWMTMSALLRHEPDQSFSGRDATACCNRSIESVTGWQVIMRCFLQEAIDGDLLELLHLSSSFERFQTLD
ncbi:hypothetical protein C8J56DRAFT_879884 [Mycena floridula]|nr:hypothetical protein C8J56DRAFT_879884 [Mycena floridula]